MNYDDDDDDRDDDTDASQKTIFQNGGENSNKSKLKSYTSTRKNTFTLLTL